jgi:adenylate cyclase class 2
MKYQELEVKFFILDLPAVQSRLISLGAELITGRVFEVNWRFDTSDYGLSNSYQVLRLRQDEKARITYKGPAQDAQGVRLRTEIEFEVSDIQAAKALLEALGYIVTVGYEKYRTTYLLDDVLVLLDELPYGNFIEVEGKDPVEITRISERLGLNWNARAPESYLVLFDRLKALEKYDFRDLTFNNFAGIKVTGDLLGVNPADFSVD